MIKLLFINKSSFYKHSSAIHVGFISWLQNKYNVIEYGRKSGFFKQHVSHRGFGQYRNFFLSYKPDVILTYNSNGSRLYKKNKDRLSWAKNIIEYSSFLKIHITTDHCQRGDDPEQTSWFKEFGIDVALFRHKSFERHPVGIESHWFPFSIDRESYLDDNFKFFNKSKKIGFIGALNKDLYVDRNIAFKFLDSNNLINYSKKRRIGKDYFSFLQSNIANLTCGGTCRYFTAKYIEILASGALLICSDTDGLSTIPSDFYLKYDPQNMDGFVDKYLQKINSKGFQKTLRISREYALVKHSHKKRFKQLDKIIKSRI